MHVLRVLHLKCDTRVMLVLSVIWIVCDQCSRVSEGTEIMMRQDDTSPPSEQGHFDSRKRAASSSPSPEDESKDCKVLKVADLVVRGLCSKDEPVSVSDTEDMQTPARGVRERKHVAVNFTWQQEQELVDWFRAHPMFYDQSHREFKARDIKDKILELKANEYGVSGSDLLIWFRSQRTIYGRLKRKYASGIAAPYTTHRQKWVLEEFNFLEQHVNSRIVADSRPKVRNEEEDEDASWGLRNLQTPTPISSLLPQSTAASPGEAEDRGPANGTPKTTNVSSMSNSSKQGGVGDGLASPGPQLQCYPPPPPMLHCSPESLPGPRSAWTRWITAEVMALHDDLWRNYQKESFDLMLRYLDLQRKQDIKTFLNGEK